MTHCYVVIRLVYKVIYIRNRLHILLIRNVIPLKLNMGHFGVTRDFLERPGTPFLRNV